MLPSFKFDSAATAEEACKLLAETGGKPIAGGTDVIPQMRDGRFQADHLVDLSHLTDLSYIKEADGRIAIGGLTNYQTLEQSAILAQEAATLVQAAGLVGGVQTRVRGTIGGNIANASPAGDTLPPLLVLDAELSLISIAGERTLPLSTFLRGPGATVREDHELIREVSFLRPPEGTKSSFTRLGNRRGMAISVVSVAALLRLSASGKVDMVRIALGAVAPTAVRCPQTEAMLIGKRLTKKRVERAAKQAVQECSPIDDVRGSADYRRHGVQVLVARALRGLAE